MEKYLQPVMEVVKFDVADETNAKIKEYSYSFGTAQGQRTVTLLNAVS